MDNLKNNSEDHILSEYYDDLEKRMKKQVKINSKFLKNEIKSRVNRNVYKEILVFISDSGDTYDYKISSEPIGELQPRLNDLFSYYVDQSVLYPIEDSYYGTVSIKLNDNEYFEFSFQM